MNPLIPGVLSGKGFISQALSFFQEYRCKLASQALASHGSVYFSLLLKPKNRHGTPPLHAIVICRTHTTCVVDPPPPTALPLSAAEGSPLHLKADPEDDLFAFVKNYTHKHTAETSSSGADTLGARRGFLKQGNLRGAGRPARSRQLPPQWLRRTGRGQEQWRPSPPPDPEKESPGELW